MLEKNRVVLFCFILFSEFNIYLFIIISIWVFNKYLILVFIVVIGEFVYL